MSELTHIEAALAAALNDAVLAAIDSAEKIGVGYIEIRHVHTVHDGTTFEVSNPLAEEVVLAVQSVQATALEAVLDIESGGVPKSWSEETCLVCKGYPEYAHLECYCSPVAQELRAARQATALRRAQPVRTAPELEDEHLPRRGILSLTPREFS